MGISKTIQDIKEQSIGNANRKALIVEGKDDELALTIMLDKFSNDWKNDWVIGIAGNKKAVLDILERESGWIGVVDKDEWDPVKIAELEAQRPNLHILPRFCLENYLIVPGELWAAFPEIQKKKISGGKDQLSSLLTTDLQKWIRHGVLWSVVNPLWEGLRSLGFKEALLNPSIATDDSEIQRILAEWHRFLNPDQIWQRYQSQLQNVRGLTVEEQLKQHVHGKSFYSEVVNPVLNTLLGTKSAGERKFSIIRTLPRMEELRPLLAKMQVVN